MANFFACQRVPVSVILLVAAILIVPYCPSYCAPSNQIGEDFFLEDYRGSSWTARNWKEEEKERAELDIFNVDRCMRNLNKVDSFEKLQKFLNHLSESINNKEISHTAVPICTGPNDMPVIILYRVRQFNELLLEALQGKVCTESSLMKLTDHQGAFKNSPLKIWWTKFVLQVSSQCERSLVKKLVEAEKTDSELAGQLKVALLLAQNVHQVEQSANAGSPDPEAISDLRELTLYEFPADSEKFEYEFKLTKDQYIDLEKIVEACDSIETYKVDLIDPIAKLNVFYGLKTTDREHLKNWLVASEVCQIIQNVQLFTQDAGDNEQLNVHLTLGLYKSNRIELLSGYRQMRRQLADLEASPSDILTDYNQGEERLKDLDIDRVPTKKDSVFFKENILKVVADSISNLL